MKKILVLTAIAVAAGFAQADTTVYWAAMESVAANGDTSAGTASLNSYSAYFCTADYAATLFGGAKTVDSVTSYLAGNYDTALSALQTSAASGPAAEVVTANKAAKLTGTAYANDSYYFRATYGSSLATIGSEYLAMLFYDNGSDREIRVMANSPSGIDMQSGNALFSDNPLSGGGTAGSWTAAPEPTSGMLLLCGFALMALKRKRV